MRYKFRKDSTADKLNEGFERHGVVAKAKPGHLDDFSGCDALIDSYFDEDDHWKDDLNEMFPSARM